MRISDWSSDVCSSDLFGRGPIGLSWLTFVLPALMLNYMGQGAMVLEAEMGARLGIIQDPFFLMMPDAWRVPIVILGLFATIIASPAVISGDFLLTRQIGRSSVWERVCLTVEIYGLPLLINKNKKDNTS